MGGQTRIVRVVGNNTEVVGTDFKTQSNPTGFTSTGSLRKTDRHGQASAEKGTSKTMQFTRKQEVTDESGITTGSHCVITGTNFTGDPQRGADNAVRHLAGITLQRGDNAGQVKPGEIVTLDFKRMASSATAGWTNSVSPAPPQITRISAEEIANYAAYWSTYIQTVNFTNAGYQAGVAARLELQRQLEQKQITLDRTLQQFSMDQITPDMLAGTPSLQDRDAQSNITRQLIYENYIPFLANLINHEQQMT